MTSQRVQRTYLILTLLQTLAASLIWGVNTLFLLDAGLSLTEAFVANAAFTAGMVLFEVPTGVIADTFGRRTSFILGAATLLVTTAAYLGLWYVTAGIWWWVLVSALIGLGFTFFSGATEAWLVDALTAQSGVRAAFPGPRFHEAVLLLDRPVAPVLESLAAEGIAGGYDLARDFPELGPALLVCATETRTSADIESYARALQRTFGRAAAA